MNNKLQSLVSSLLSNSKPRGFFHFYTKSLQPHRTSDEAIYQISHSFLWSHKTLYTTLFTNAVVLTETFKQTLMCKISACAYRICTNSLCCALNHPPLNSIVLAESHFLCNLCFTTVDLSVWIYFQHYLLYHDSQTPPCLWCPFTVTISCHIQQPLRTSKYYWSKIYRYFSILEPLGAVTCILAILVISAMCPSKIVQFN